MTDVAKPPWVVRIPTPVWLLILIAAAIAIGVALKLEPVLSNRPAGIALAAVGIALSGWARLAFRKQGAEIFPWSETHGALVGEGPFRFSRNPMYLGLVVVGIGAALIAGTWLMWLVPVLLFVLDHFVIIPFEECSMERTFGEDYRAYRARVRRWL